MTVSSSFSWFFSSLIRYSKPLSSSYVAKYAIDKMFQNKVIIIPGFKMKLVTFFRRLVPRNLILKITYNFQRRKKP